MPTAAVILSKADSQHWVIDDVCCGAFGQPRMPRHLCSRAVSIFSTLNSYRPKLSQSAKLGISHFGSGIAEMSIGCSFLALGDAEPSADEAR